MTAETKSFTIEDLRTMPPGDYRDSGEVRRGCVRDEITDGWMTGTLRLVAMIFEPSQAPPDCYSGRIIRQDGCCILYSWSRVYPSDYKQPIENRMFYLNGRDEILLRQAIASGADPATLTVQDYAIGAPFGKMRPLEPEEIILLTRDRSDWSPIFLDAHS